MGKAVADATLDAALDVVATGDQETLCSAQPTTYYEAVDATAFAISTAYSLNDAVRPTTRNGFCYQVTTAGTSAGSEPTWGTTPGGTTTSGSVTFTCRTNYALCAASLSAGDYTKADGSTSGRKITIGAKSGQSVIASGTATHVAITDNGLKALPIVTTCSSTAVTSGNQANIGSWAYEINDPT